MLVTSICIRSEKTSNYHLWFYFRKTYFPHIIEWTVEKSIWILPMFFTENIHQFIHWIPATLLRIPSSTRESSIEQYKEKRTGSFCLFDLFYGQIDVAMIHCLWTEFDEFLYIWCPFSADSFLFTSQFGQV